MISASWKVIYSIGDTWEEMIVTLRANTCSELLLMHKDLMNHLAERVMISDFLGLEETNPPAPEVSISARSV